MAIELMAYGITHTPCTAIKPPTLVDFVTEWIEAHAETTAVDLEHWSMYFDGSLMLQGAGVGVILVSPSGNYMRYVLQLCFEGATDNVAEYEALLHGLCIAITLDVRRLITSGDSELIVNQVMKALTCHNHKMEA